ncbi:hypothetical protein ARAM_001509 [Aspergillus rambellii]|uniref:Uncharacterized protein n=1 Tax=Aspergillus rambellii TaxID=308745 RepID=A0A0F8X2B0_9EURO|nr:hypothetical protein ARAM_001509 [Aspergillus rambellii]
MHTHPSPDPDWSSSSSSTESLLSSEDSGQDSQLEQLQDSVTKKRRHAIYVHRPPIWHYKLCQDQTSSSTMSSTRDGKNYGLSSNSPARNSFHQTKPNLCTRLHSYKDIRLGAGEQWAIHEGSVVIGLGAEYTLLGCHESRPDQFEVVGGDVYVICCLYADLWALCAKLSVYSLPTRDSPMPLAFLPLCAVTLAANFSAFTRRTLEYARGDFVLTNSKHPGNGLPVIPPQRSHSLNASRQIFNGHQSQISLPLTVHDAFQNLSLIPADSDFVPLDSTLEPIFSTLTRRPRHLLRGLVTSRPFLKFRGGGRVPSKPSSFLSFYHKDRLESTEVGSRHLRTVWNRSLGTSHRYKWLSVKSS